MGRRSLNIGDRMKVKRKLEEMEMRQKQATKKMNPAHLQLDDSDVETDQDDDGREMEQSNGKLMKLKEDDKDEDTEGEDDEEFEDDDNKETEEGDAEFEDEEFEDEESEDEEFEDEESEDDDEDSDDDSEVRRGMTATFVHSSEFLQNVREELQDMTERENKILKTVAPLSYQLLMNTTNLANP